MRSVRKSQLVKRIERHAGQATEHAVLARRILGIPMKFNAGSEIWGEGEPVDYVYEVGDGAVRTVKVLSDGRRKIGGFYFAGDIFGFEDGNEHCLSAEAVVASRVRVIKRKTLIQLAADDLELAEELLTMAMSEVGHAHRHALMLVMTAQERVKGFLVEMAERISVGDLVQLPMSRRDIADYLGLTIETVSRTITALADTSMIRLSSSRAIVLHDLPALAQATAAEIGIAA
jgi:CRP-like cAMP-binding protein